MESIRVLSFPGHDGWVYPVCLEVSGLEATRREILTMVKKEFMEKCRKDSV